MRINFVILNETEERLEHLRGLQPSRDWKAFNDGVHAWILQTFLLVGQHLGATLSARFASDAINIIHNSQLLTHSGSVAGFVLGVRADYPSSRASHWEIVQNMRQASQTATWMPHWPQQALISRSTASESVKRVGYFGRGVNHYTRLLRHASGFDRVSTAVERCCSKAGLELVKKGPDCWNDYSDVDIALGIRGFGRKRFETKPATKLFNAWRALVPFVGGADCAFEQVGRHGETYTAIQNERQLLSALIRLRDDDAYHAGMVEAGKEQSALYAPERICERWRSALESLWSNRWSSARTPRRQEEWLEPTV